MKRIWSTPVVALLLMISLMVTFFAGNYQVQAVAEPVFTVFHATLLQSNEVPPVPFTGASGHAHLVLDRQTNQLSYTVSVSGIGDAVAAHIHRGLVGENGPVVINLLGSQELAPGTPLTGTVQLNAVQVAELYSGLFYVNVHTAAHPTGELRGQVFTQEFTRSFSAVLRGENEVPPVVSDGSGLGRVWLNDALTSFAYEVMVTDIPSATLTHIHRAPAGSNGPVVFDLKQGRPFDPANPITGTFSITPTQLANLFAGNYYVNVHTVAHPPGELRGQLLPNTLLLGASLSGANEVPPVTTDASGDASFELDAATGQLDFTVTVAAIENVTGAHIHQAPPGENGPVIFNLLTTGGGTLTPDTPLRGTLTLTPTQILTLLNGDYYVNVHTQANPAGEVRGQIGEQRRFLTYRSVLNGASERPDPVDTPASGLAFMTLDTATNELTYKVTVEDIDNIVGAHFHTGPITGTGPVVFDILEPGFGPGSPLEGTITLNAAQVAAFTSGGYYINVHTTEFPAGEIRGQVFPVSVAGDYPTTLLGSNEVPPVSTNANGFALISINETQTELHYTVTVTDINNVRGAHIHLGAPGENGPIIYNLLPPGETLGPGDPISGTIVITPTYLNELLLGNLYVNVHTQQNRGGEIRGQIGVTQALPEADLSVVKQADRQVRAGTPLAYTLIVTNNGPSDASPVVVVDTLPAGTTFVEGSSECQIDSTYADPTVVCVYPSLAASATLTVSLLVQVDETIRGLITNAVEVKSDTPDPDLSNNVAAARTTVQAPNAAEANLGLIKTGPATAAAGGQLVYTLIISNTGPARAAGVVVSDTLPLALTFGGASATQGTCTPAGQTVTCNLEDVAAGNFVTMTITTTVSSVVSGTIVNTAEVTSGSFDPDSANDVDSTATRILQPNVLPDLALTKGGPPDVEAGTELTYTLTVQNTGLVTGTQVVLTDELPNGVDFVRAVQGCAIDPIYPDPTVVCSLGALGPGATRTITLVVLVDETTSGTITNQAEVSGALPETNIGNNRATATTNVLPVGGVEADLSIGKVAARNSVRAGEQVTYTLTISNAGPATATNVVVTDTLHISTTLEAVSSSQGVCPTSGTGVVCNLGTLAVGATAIVTVTVEVNETALGNVTNTATVAGGISDPRLDNNTATATVNVLPAVQEGGLLFLPFIAK